MSALREAAQAAVEAIEEGRSFEHLDNVVAPALRAALERQLTIEEIEDLWAQCGYTGRAPLGFARALARML